MEGIGLRIALARKAKGLSQKELGKKCFVTQGAISSWEKERTEPNMKNIDDLCAALEITMDELVYGRSISEEVKEVALKASQLQRLSPILMELSDESYDALIDYANLLLIKDKSTGITQ